MSGFLFGSMMALAVIHSVITLWAAAHNVAYIFGRVAEAAPANNSYEWALLLFAASYLVLKAARADGEEGRSAGETSATSHAP